MEMKQISQIFMLSSFTLLLFFNFFFKKSTKTEETLEGGVFIYPWHKHIAQLPLGAMGHLLTPVAEMQQNSTVPLPLTWIKWQLMLPSAELLCQELG